MSILRYILLSIFLFIELNGLNAQMNIEYKQNYEWVRRIGITYGITTTGTPSFYQAFHRLYEFIPFTGDSAGYDTLTVKSDNPDNILVTVCDTNTIGKSSGNGKLTGSFVLKGITSIYPLFANDGSFYAATKQSDHIYSGNDNVYNKYKPNNSDGAINYLVRCNLKGYMSYLDTFHVNCVIRLGGYSIVAGSFFVMFSNVTDFDTLDHNHALFKKGMTTLIKLNENGRIIQHWLFDGIFTDLFITQNEKRLNIYGKTTKHISDQYTQDIALASFDIDIGEFIWHHIIKTNGGLLSAFANDYSFLVSLGYTDTLSLNGRKIISDSGYHGAKTILISYGNNGAIKWYRTAINGNATVSNMQVFEDNINFLVYTYSTIPGQFSWNGHNLNSSTFFYGSNRLILDANGNVVKFYPVPKGEPPGTFFTPDNDRYYLNYYLKDADTLRGVKYIVRSNALNFNDYLFTSVYNYTSNVILFKQTINSKIIVYPNPTNNSFIFKGFGGSNPCNIKIYDLNGNMVLSRTQSINDPVNISGLDKGIYFVNLEIYKNKYYTKVIKE